MPGAMVKPAYYMVYIYVPKLPADVANDVSCVDNRCRCLVFERFETSGRVLKYVEELYTKEMSAEELGVNVSVCANEKCFELFGKFAITMSTDFHIEKQFRCFAFVPFDMSRCQLHLKEMATKEVLVAVPSTKEVEIVATEWSFELHGKYVVDAATNVQKNGDAFPKQLE